MFEHWFYQLIGSVPQAIAVICLGTAIVKEKYTARQLLVAGAVTGLVSFLIQTAVKQDLLTYGIHIPLSIILAIIIVCLLLRLSLLKSAVATLVPFLAVIILELLTVMFLTVILDFPIDNFDSSPDHIKFMFGLPSLVILAVLATVAQVRLRYGTKKNP